MSKRLPVDFCVQCGRELASDEKALTRKLIHRGATAFYCLACLADHFQVEQTALEQKIIEYRQMGCTLFEPQNGAGTENRF